jgi:hypothetical protein
VALASAADRSAVEQRFAVWAKGLEHLAVARAVDALAGDGPAEVIDVGGGVAVQYEFVKFLREARAAAPVDYTVVGGDAHALKATVLHDAQNGAVRYEVGPWPSRIPSGAVLVVNHAEAVRARDGGLPNLAAAAAHDGALCLVARASDTTGTVNRMTVKGRVIPVPALDDLRALRAEAGGDWLERWDDGHDAGFFLPEPDAAPVGLWMAVRGVASLRGFTAPGG